MGNENEYGRYDTENDKNVSAEETCCANENDIKHEDPEGAVCVEREQARELHLSPGLVFARLFPLLDFTGLSVVIFVDPAELAGSNCVVLFFRLRMTLSKDIQTCLVVSVEILQLVFVLLVGLGFACNPYTADNAPDDQWIENLHYHHHHGYHGCGHRVIPFEDVASCRGRSSWDCNGSSRWL